MTSYSEGDLIIPALRVIRENSDDINTSDLRKFLERKLDPSGDDLKILSGRPDTVFTQKVRNLKSHNTLEKLGFANYNNGIWTITEEGVNYLEEIEKQMKEEIKDSLKNQGLDEDELSDEEKDNYTGIIIEEGALINKSGERRVRSSKLRSLVIEKFKDENEGELFCTVCYFNYKEKYGSLGEGYIELHHKKPIHKMNIEGTQTSIDKAIEKVTLLCANCHRMVHRKKGEILTIKELKSLID